MPIPPQLTATTIGHSLTVGFPTPTPSGTFSLSIGFPEVTFSPVPETPVSQTPAVLSDTGIASVSTDDSHSDEGSTSSLNPVVASPTANRAGTISNVGSEISSTSRTILPDVSSSPSLTTTSGIPLSSSVIISSNSTTTSPLAIASSFTPSSTPPPDSQTGEGTPANPTSLNNSTSRNLSIRLTWMNLIVLALALTAPTI
ncbi:hypothetical protein DL96DRAFT_104386 [Flagelloscypha sp. PMI_526]|nr:hypothetical protein DL96DRAFT_104386 [Flagelloscypha sp. PMI_526]